MECPVCGCPVEEPADGFIASCDCCRTIWVVSTDHRTLDHVLVGPEG
jgi:hypothetical protein